MIEFKERVKEIFKDAGTFLKWVLFACIIGIVVGLVGVLFHYCIEMAAGLRNTYNWLIWLLPLGGVTIILMYRYLKMEKDRGTNFVLIAVRANEKLPLKTAPLIFISTVITHLFGGSSGREGAALQLGGSISAQIGRWMHLDDKDSRIITMCGMSAAFSALFGTPLTAAIFSMEVISVGIMYYSAIVPCVLASVIGAFISSLFSIGPAHYIIVGIPDINALTILQVLGLAFVCALLSILFCIIMHKSSAFCRKFLPNPIICIVLAGFMIVGLTYIVGVNDYNGAGMDVIGRAIGGEARPEAFALKILFTAITLGAGFKGGEIVPVFFIGATFGNTFGNLIGLNPSFGASLGLVSVFCGVTNCPITSIILSIELFGADGLIFYGLACAASYMLSGYYSLYSEQKIVYSKTRPEFIDKKAN